ncbi:hypothetical protein [Nocardia miyunensis]|uniref:hypothetical protein n=1 Tax=Nocardia miyunensis TaxID=282684 RepID=UPI000B11B364|nr:hypothetical protein [Nocardia miyunensis]
MAAKTQVNALETLIHKLADPTTPVPPRVERPKPRRARQIDADRVAELITGYQHGVTVYELATRFGIERRTVSNTLYPARVPVRRGLSPDQVDIAIHLYKLGWSLARVGNHLNVNHTAVLTALRRRRIPTRDSRGRARV